MDEEQPVRVILLFDLSEARIVAPPIRLLPSLLEVVALAHIRAAVGRDRAQLVDASIDALRGFTPLLNARLMSRDSGIRGLLPIGNDRQREGAQHRRIGRGVFRPRDGLGRRARRGTSIPYSR